MDQGIPLGWEFEVACGGLPKWLLPEQEVLRTGGGGPLKDGEPALPWFCFVLWYLVHLLWFMEIFSRNRTLVLNLEFRLASPELQGFL